MSIKYRNPVWPGYMADPFVLRAGGEYFAYGTGGPEDGGRQADGRMFPLLRSRNLADWEHAGGALIPLEDPDTRSYWAPAVAERDGRFFLYYSAGGLAGEGHRLRVATADTPVGPFVDAERVLLPEEPFSIDPHPFRDPKDGRWYLFFAKDYLDGPRCGTGVAAVELAEDMISVMGTARTIYRACWDWQIFERGRHWYGEVWEAWHTVEGPCVMEHEGRYFCFYSGGRWETPQYGVGFCAADSVLGPYGDDTCSEGPAVLKEIPHRVLGPGHNTVVQGPDGDAYFIVYHAWDPERTARRMCIDQLLWTPEGPTCDGPSFTERLI